MTFKKFLMKHINGMLECFHLQHFDVHLGSTTKSANMDILVDYEYLEATIRVSKGMAKLYERGYKEEVLKCLCHEICHILTSWGTDGIRLNKHQRKQDEQANEHISRLLYRLYKERK